MPAPPGTSRGAQLARDRDGDEEPWGWCSGGCPRPGQSRRHSPRCGLTGVGGVGGGAVEEAGGAGHPQAGHAAAPIAVDAGGAAVAALLRRGAGHVAPRRGAARVPGVACGRERRWHGAGPWPTAPLWPLQPPPAPAPSPPCSGPCAESPMLTASWLPKEFTPITAPGPWLPSEESCAGARGTLYSASAMSAARFRMMSWGRDGHGHGVTRGCGGARGQHRRGSGVAPAAGPGRLRLPRRWGAAAPGGSRGPDSAPGES